MDQWTPSGCSLTAYGRPLLIGFCAGILSGLLGVGGAVIMIPTMVFLLHVSQHRAHGTSLAAVLLISISAAFAYHAKGNLVWGDAVLMSFGIIAGALIGANIANALPARKLRAAFGYFLMVFAVIMVLKASGHLGGSGGSPTEAGAWVKILIGVTAGILSGLLGIGGGIILVPAMVLLLNTDQHVAQGISLAVIIPASLTGGAVYFRKGNVDLPLAVLLGVGGALGAQVSAGWAQSLPSQTLQVVFAVFLVYSGISMSRKRPRSAGAPLGSELDGVK